MSEVQNTAPKAGLSWLGFFFAPAYFAGYGKFRKGILMAFIGGFPVANFGVAGYGLVQAKKELPIKQQPFDWGKAIITLVLQVVFAVIITGAVQNFKDGFQRGFDGAGATSSIASEVSGVWKEEPATLIAIQLEGAPKYIQIDKNKFPVTIQSEDQENHILSVALESNQGELIWTLRQIYDDEGKAFTLKFTSHTGESSDLSFVRNL